MILDIDALLDTDLAASMQDSFRETWEKFLEEMEKEAGMQPSDFSMLAMGFTETESDPLMVIRFRRSLDDEERDKFMASLRVREPALKEVAGSRFWSSSPRRTAMGELRGDTFVCGRGSSVEAALRRYAKGDVTPLVAKLIDEDGLKGPVCAAVDWRNIPLPESRAFRQLRATLGTLSKHLGLVVLKANVDDGARVSLRGFDPEDNVVVRYQAEVEGEFLQAMLADFARRGRTKDRRSAR
ncbi:MAG: hypothetical protein AAGD14_13240 [Planctomycetota bacterium]